MNKATGSIKVGDVAELTKTITEQDVLGFAAATGDTNPIHMDAAYAATTPFEKRIAHGMFLAGLVSAVLGTKMPGPGAVYLSQTLQFRLPVFIGDTVTARVEVATMRQDKPIVTLNTMCRNEKGEVVLEGQAVLKLPK